MKRLRKAARARSKARVIKKVIKKVIKRPAKTPGKKIGAGEVTDPSQMSKLIARSVSWCAVPLGHDAFVEVVRDGRLWVPLATSRIRSKLMAYSRLVLLDAKTGELAACRALKLLPKKRVAITRAMAAPVSYRLAAGVSTSTPSWVVSPNLPPELILMVRKLHAPGTDKVAKSSPKVRMSRKRKKKPVKKVAKKARVAAKARKASKPASRPVRKQPRRKARRPATARPAQAQAADTPET